MVHFGFGHKGDCMKVTKTVNDNIDNFPGGLYSPTRTKLLAWVLQVPSTNRNHGSGGKNDERHPHIQERPYHLGHILQSLEYKAPSLPITNKKNEDLPRTRG